MPDSIVLQLQAEALDRRVRVTDLLRKALVVARKLQRKDFETWIRWELEGCPNDATFPPYRQVKGELRGWNPFHGWLPVFFANAQDAETLSLRTTAQAITEIDDMLQPAKKATEIMMPYEERVQQKIQEATGEVTSFVTMIPAPVFARIVEGVRTAVLNWTLELEEQGVIGEGLSFSPEERRAAAAMSGVTAVFHGPVHSAQIQHPSPHAVQMVAPPLDADQSQAVPCGHDQELGRPEAFTGAHGYSNRRRRHDRIPARRPET